MRNAKTKNAATGTEADKFFSELDHPLKPVLEKRRALILSAEPENNRTRKTERPELLLSG